MHKDNIRGLERMESLVDLCDLFNKSGSNKDRDGCIQVYHTLFRDIQNESLNILEIGIGPDNKEGKSSLYVWRDFFTNAHIVGVDIDQNVLLSNDERIQSHLCDSTVSNDVSDLIEKIGIGKFDIIVDDGSQRDMDRVKTLKNFYPYLKQGGIYIIQNILSDSKLVSCPGLIGCVCNHDTYFFTGLKQHMCVIYKSHINTKRTVY